MRRAIDATIRILWKDGDGRERVSKAKVADVSANGVKLRMGEKIPVRSYVSCNDEALGIAGNASVRYCLFSRGQYEIGLEFASGIGIPKNKISGL